ncbi:putative NRPS-like enzyme [Astrocystis sublimbata]|nr:putative NRPS-like enzyme [Astrocystis sublimbata]
MERWQNELLPHMVDRVARESPDRAYGLWPNSSTSYEKGYHTITYSQLANAVNGLAWWLIEQLGPGHGDVIAFIGPNDMRMTALLYAAMKTNYVLFFPSPRNSAAAHKVLLDTLKCKTLITTAPVPPTVAPVLDVAQPKLLTALETDRLLSQTYEHYTCDRTYEKNGQDPIWAIHTSGSTGFPKPIIWTSEAIVRHCNGTDATPPGGTPSLDHFERGKRVLTTLPPFHGAGLGQYIFWGIPFGSVPIAPLAAAIPTAQGIVEALKQTPADIALLVPSVVAELAEDPVSLDYVAANVKLIVYLGGDLPKAFGDRVAAKIPVRCQWGCSELGFAPQLWPSELGPQDWRYIRFHPCSGAVFEETVNGAYELVFRKQESLLATQPVWSISGQEHLDEFRTRDLFEPHPTVADAWCWRARTDDIIVFLNGEKTNPVSMEQSIVANNPEITGAMVIGAQRFQAALLVEPASTVTITTTADQAALIERIWPSIEDANSVAPAHARVEKSMILIATPNRPLKRTAKGSMQRAATLAPYAVELEKLYSDADAEVDMTSEVYSSMSPDMIRRRIRDIVLETTGWKDLGDSIGFFDNGMDSLQALRIIRALRRGLGASYLGLSTLYHNPSIVQLATSILTHKSGENDGDLVKPLLSTYSELLQQIAPAKPDDVARDNIDDAAAKDVILTGSTGGMGTYILQSLLDRPGIGHIFCLNRAPNGGRAVQGTRFEAAGLARDRLDHRVTFLQSDSAQPLLGLDEKTYQLLRSRVSLIIHNAWPVNFNLDLLAFRPHLAGVVNLFALCNAAAASRGESMRFLFVSSVGVVLDGPPGLAPEALIEVPPQSQPQQHDGSNGYSKSKLIAEHLCACAARHLGIPVIVTRVGQVAGAVKNKGVWNPAEWLPSLIMSSRYLGCLPNSLGSQFSAVDWVPVDALADVMIDLLTYQGGGVNKTVEGVDVFNVRNPALVSWGDVSPAIKEAIEAELGRAVEVVSPETWLTRLEKSIEATSTDAGADIAIKANPAVKLVDFYRDSLWSVSEGLASTAATPQPPMAIEKSLNASPTLRDLPPVSPSWMRKWVDEWLVLAASLDN